MKVYVILTDNIEGQKEIHSVYSSYDLALDQIHIIMSNEYLYSSPECWKPLNRNSWWFYGCESLGIEEYELLGQLPEVK